MDPEIGCPDNNGPTMDIDELIIICEFLEELEAIIYKYLSGARGLVVADVLGEAISMAVAIEHKINNLHKLREKYAIELDELTVWFRMELGACTKWITFPAATIHRHEKKTGDEEDNTRDAKDKGNSGKNDKDEEDEGDGQDPYSKYEERTVGNPDICDAQKAVAKCIEVCDKAIMENDETTSWFSQHGLYTINSEYMKARDIVKKVIQATTNDDETQSGVFDIVEAERILVDLRKYWLDSRLCFGACLSDQVMTSGLEEEREMGLVYLL
ncbi:hypothetical protein F5B21DRAFT_487784 [Xylaria acuta]|nr:hypothetical protein F5B21DRAFT_487784 [Xylaria acuta]